VSRGEQWKLDRRAFFALLGAGAAAGAVGALESCGDAAGESPRPRPEDAGADDPMDGRRIYTVTDWGAVAGDPSVDLADAFDAIFEDLDTDPRAGGAIFLPPGTYTLRRTVRLRHDFLTICGFGPGFATGTGRGGGSRVRVEAEVGFWAPRAPGAPRVNSLAFCDFILDGGAVDRGRRGIVVEQDSDAVVVVNMAMKELDEALVLRAADAASITQNMILENRSCLRLVESGKALVVANNRLGGKPGGITAFCEGQERMVFEGNDVFPDGSSNVVLKNCRHCAISGNQLQSYYTGALYLEGDSDRNAVTGNAIVSEPNPDGAWNADPVRPRPPDFGVVRVEGADNLLAGNHVTSAGGADHVMVAVEGPGNRLADLALVADADVRRKISVRAGTAARPTRVLHSTAEGEATAEAGVVWTHVPIPPPVVA
jgi:hypothetical protein